MKNIKKYRVLVLLHQDLIPPEVDKLSEEERDTAPWVTEFDVISTLKNLGHEVRVQGVYSDLQIIQNIVNEFKPHTIFNLMEEFHGDPLYDQNIVSYLELLQVAYTGSNPIGLILARDKSLAKKVLTYHKIKTPNFFVALKNKKYKIPSQMKYPMIVKCLSEEASYGISKASIVQSQDKLEERIEYINANLNADAIVEEFIEGREFYVGVIGNNQLKTFPVWELVYENIESPEKEIYSSSAKWNTKYRKRKGIKHQRADIPAELEKELKLISKRAYRRLQLNGYGRMDFRVTSDGGIYLLEANPNPNIALDDEFAKSAQKSSLSYKKLIQDILNLSMSWKRGDY